MAQITSSVGLISGINTTSLINSLIQEDSGPVNLLTSRVTADQTLGEAYTAIGTQLQTIQSTAKALELPTTFSATTANSSNPAVLTATTTAAAAVGTYSLQVARLVATQQLVGAGFTDATNAKVGAGTITIGLGGGSSLATQTPLSALNGGNGVGRGQFRITDRSGATAVIDTTSAVSLDDVVDAINTATTISVRASVKDDQLVLTDTSGKTASNLIVQDLGTGTSAADLGIAANVAAATVTGTSINYLTRQTSLAALNDGTGVGRAAAGGNDLTFTTRSGAAVNVSLATAATLGDVIDAINTAGAGRLTASIPAGATGIKVVDDTTGGPPTTLSVVADNGSTAAADLGLTAAVTGKNTITGNPILGSLDTTLLSSLDGGAGVTLGSVKFTDAAGHNQTISLAADASVQDVINTINTSATTAKVTAALNAAGTGLQITDTSGGAGSLTVADTAGTTSATALGIAGTAAAGATTIEGANLHKQWVTSATRLSTLNGGTGIDAGTFQITTAAGKTATIDLSAGNVKTVGDLLYQINSKGVPGLTASVNATGNGILLSDTSTGSGKLTVTDTSGTAAADLNLAGTAGFGSDSINGAYEKTIAVGANDTLTTVAAAINAADAGVTASVIDDGSATAPYRLSLTAKNSGTAGQVQFDSGATNLGTRTLVAAQDAAVFVGGAGTAGQPLLVTSATNTVANVIPGVTLNLTGASTAPVQLTVAQDADGIVQQVGTLVTTINSVTAGIDSQNTYNTSSQTAGLLLGDGPTQQILAGLLGSITTVASAGVGQYKSLAAVGITIGADDQVTFDESTFRQALATDPSAVESLFDATSTVTNADGTKTTTNHGLAYNFDKVLTTLVDPASGTLTVAESTLTTEVQQFQDQITSLNALLDQKRAVYETQFANMEVALAQLQSQQQALSSIGTLSSSATTSAGTSGIGSSSSSSSGSSSSSTTSSGS